MWFYFVITPFVLRFTVRIFPALTSNAGMSSNSKIRKVVERNGSLGHLKGDHFYSESNFVITRVICCVHLGDQKGYIVKIKGTYEDVERQEIFSTKISYSRRTYSYNFLKKQV